jgi:catechol 2,3-dioxygenase-like lactoylglutathione lyase family enzyme
MKELRNLDRELTKISSESQNNDAKGEVYSRMLNTVDWLSFLVNEKMVTDKRLLRTFSSLPSFRQAAIRHRCRRKQRHQLNKTKGVLLIMDMKLEVLFVPVSDVDRAKRFYEKLGFRLDIDYIANEDFRGIQFTPPGSEASIIFGKGITSAQPGSIDRPVLAVYDIDAARDNLIARGVDVSEVFHYAGGPFNNAVKNPRVGGRDPQGRSYYSFASFEDPDGNGWLLQEIQTRLPGREWNLTRPQAMDVATLAGLLRETAEHHGHFEKTHDEHHWWDWYAPYLSARQSGSNPEEAAAAADRYMEEVLHVVPR